jgi:hypothetical protein
MSRPPQTAQPDTNSYIQIRLPGWLKNKLAETAKQQNTTLNTYIITALTNALNTEHQIPPPPQAAQPLPTTSDQIRAYITGQKLTGPCGQTNCTAQTNNHKTDKHTTFCTTCGIRIT